MKILKILPFLFMVVLAGSCGGQTNTSEKAPISGAEISGNEEGESVYTIYCTPCHGDDGKKGLTGATDLSTSKLTEEETKTVIEQGRNTMTPFKGVISGEEIDALVKYLQTLKK